ncbi:putative glutathione peroxidase [Apostichopus japonicus]|uniref:Glutathione peroxidase n=1 Tax=Stichopus japonicus TaxID=307972 RepID=A0A2G8JZ09_STIJA|nr:putative glutathione peroxidase [Apostichopus japonicus]
MVTKLFFITLWWLPVGSGHPAEMSSYCHTGANSIHGYTLVPLDGGEETPLSLYEGKVLIIVNVASFCQYTSQYLDFNELKNIAELEGKIEVIGVPSNQFGLQEPEQMERRSEIVSNTSDRRACPAVKEEIGDPAIRFWSPFKNNDITWNFNKFLIGPDGTPLKRYDSEVEPFDLLDDIHDVLIETKKIEKRKNYNEEEFEDLLFI